MPKTTTQDPKKAEAVKMLRKFCPRGSTVYGIVRKVSGNGMSRQISFYSIRKNKPQVLDGYISNLLPHYKRVPMEKGEGLKVGGCGMNMIFAVVNDLASELYGDGYALKNESL
jgi:hypothetical protein